MYFVTNWGWWGAKCLLASVHKCFLDGAGSKLGLQIYVFGPETHMTAIVGMALGQRTIPKPARPEQPALQPQPLTLLGKNVSDIITSCSNFHTLHHGLFSVFNY